MLASALRRANRARTKKQPAWIILSRGKKGEILSKLRPKVDEKAARQA